MARTAPLAASPASFQPSKATTRIAPSPKRRDSGIAAISPGYVLRRAGTEDLSRLGPLVAKRKLGGRERSAIPRRRAVGHGRHPRRHGAVLDAGGDRPGALLGRGVDARGCDAARRVGP